jgi:hypothetical protein
MRPILAKDEPHRDRALLDIAHTARCFLNIVGACARWPSGCDPVHANWQADGRGFAHKTHDCFAVPGCRPCHNAIDAENWLTREQKQAYHYAAFKRYAPWLIAQREVELIEITAAELAAFMDGDRNLWLSAWKENRIRVRNKRRAA